MRGSRSRSLGGNFRLVLQRLAPSGSHVKVGDTVAEFDPQYMVTRLDDLRADVHERVLINQRIDASTEIKRENLDHRIRSARAVLDKAELDLKTISVRSAMQAERFAIAREEAEARLDNLLVERRHFDDSERSQLRREELQLRDVQYDLERAQANLDRMVFRTPIDGVVVMGYIQRGNEMAEIGEGDEVRAGHAFLQVVDMDSLYLYGAASQVDEQVLAPGSRALIHVDAVPGLEIKGHVAAVGAVASGTRYRPDWVRQVTVHVIPDHVDRRVFPNFSASADIVLASESARAVVPRQCIQAVGGGRHRAMVSQPGDGGEAVWLEREVELGIASNVDAAVRAGLNPGEEVACGPTRGEFDRGAQ